MIDTALTTCGRVTRATFAGHSPLHDHLTQRLRRRCHLGPGDKRIYRLGHPLSVSDVHCGADDSDRDSGFVVVKYAPETNPPPRASR